MTLPSRRAFLETSLAGFASAIAGHTAPPEVAPPPHLPVAPPPRAIEPVPSHLDPHETLFLTWQRDPTTTMTVQWIGPPLPATTGLRYSARDGDIWKSGTITTAPFPKTDFLVHRCELSGLASGSEYLFQIGKNSPTRKFRTMPRKATDTFTFVSGGDCGTNAHAIANNILAAKQEPQFALLGGDLAYDNGRSAGTAIKFYRNYAQHMIDPKGRHIPLVACLGNHEVTGGYKGKRADATFFMPLFGGLYRDTSYATLDFGDYLSLVLLDSGHVSPIAGEQTNWLARALKDRAERPHLFAVNHVPAYPSYRAPDGFLGRLGVSGTGVANRRFWCPLFEDFGVDAVLEHHDHTFKRTFPLKGGMKDRYGVPYLGDGSWGQLRSPIAPEKRPYLAHTSKSYHMTVHRLEGEVRYHVALEEGGRIADVYGSTGKRPAKRG